MCRMDLLETGIKLIANKKLANKKKQQKMEKNAEQIPSLGDNDDDGVVHEQKNAATK